MSEEMGRAKATIRHQMLALRAAVTEQDRAAWSAAVVERVAATAAFRAADVCCSYVPMPEEVQVGELARIADGRGCVVMLPAFDPVERLYRMRIWDLRKPLRAGHWNIPEPEGGAFDAPMGRICMLVPGIAFDAAGNRVGYGAGYYDRMLQRVRAHAGNQVTAIGVAFPFQLHDALPVEPHDQVLDAVVTASAWIDGKGGAMMHGETAWRTDNFCGNKT